MTKALWTTEEEIGHAVGDADEKWVACDLVHAHLGQNGLIGQPMQNAEVVQARNEHIEGFATFGADSSLVRGTQRLPSGSMHRGETVEMFVEIGGVRAEITGIKLPQNAHYNIFRANKGYNVFLNQRDIQASRKFRTVKASGSVFVGLGTAEQKSLIFGEYSVVKTRPATGRETAMDLLSRAMRMPKKVRITAFDQQTQMMATITLEQDVSAQTRFNAGDEPMYSVTYIEVYVPFHYTTGHPADQSWAKVVKDERDSAAIQGHTLQAKEEDTVVPPPPPAEKADAAIETFCDAVGFYRETNPSELAKLDMIEALAKEEDEEVVDAHIGAAMAASAQDGHDGLYDFEDIAGVVDKVKKWAVKRYQRFQDWRAKRKGKASGEGGEEEVDSEMVDSELVEQIGISLRDRFLNLKSRAKKTDGLKYLKDGALIDLLRQEVTQAETLRAAGNNATDNVNFALNIVQAMRRRSIPMTTDIADLQTRVNKLAATKGAAAQGKRQNKAVSAAELRAANQNKLYGRGSSTEAAEAAAAEIGRELIDFCALERWDTQTTYAIGLAVTGESATEDEHIDQQYVFIAADQGAAALSLDMEEIAGLIQRFKDWRAKRKAKKAQQQEEPVEATIANLDLVGISILDRIKNLRSRAKKTDELKYLKDGPLTDLLRQEVTQAETLRAAGNNATDNVNMAINIVQAMRRRSIPMTPEIADLQTRVNKLQATKGAAAQGKRQNKAVSAAELRAANQNKLYGRGGGGDAAVPIEAPLTVQPVNAEVLEDIAALVDTLTALQSEVKQEFAQFAAENKEGPYAADVRTFENQLKELSRVRAVLTQHAVDLHADEKGTKDYDEIGVHVHEAINLAQDEFLGLSRVGISILDRIKNLRARNQKARSLKFLKDGALLDMFRQEVQSAETLRGTGNNATDNVNSALNIREEIRRRTMPLTPEIVGLIERLNKLQATKGATAQGKRQNKAVSAAELRAANQNKLYGRDGPAQGAASATADA